jgi:hypothetical protein
MFLRSRVGFVLSKVLNLGRAISLLKAKERLGISPSFQSSKIKSSTLSLGERIAEISATTRDGLVIYWL